MGAFLGGDAAEAVASEDDVVSAVAAATTLEAMRANPRTSCAHWRDTWGVVLNRDRTKNFMLRNGELIGDFLLCKRKWLVCQVIQSQNKWILVQIHPSPMLDSRAVS